MRRALIVDDSKTAQIRLKRLLGRYELEVDTALSGEDALAYLSYRTPVVIFMDHTMEGMDGFEALKIIKANPSTAMIPVIMYTAQKGDVYVGQARALGALDILSKEVIKPSNLERVLRALNIRPAGSNTLEVVSAQSPADLSDHVETSKEIGKEDHNLNQIRSQVARLFEIHIADVRTQIAENTKFIIRRLSRDIDRHQETPDQSGSADVPEEVVEREIAAERTRLGLVSNSLLLLILLGIASLAWMLFDTRELVGKPLELATETTSNADSIRKLTEQTNQLRDQVIEGQRQKSRLLNVLTWAMENDLRYSFSAGPLNEEQVNKLYSLIYMLDHAGYNGTVMLEIHLGNFCLTQGEGGTWVLADPATPVTACTQVSELGLGLNETEYMSIQYLNFEQSAAPLVEGKIDLEVEMVGTTMPRYPYPPLTAATTAGEWNTSAIRNNRLTVLF